MRNGYREKEIENALKWFDNPPQTKINYHNCVKGNEKFADCGFSGTYYTQNSKRGDFPGVLDPDSSPKAWEHYIRCYTPKTFGRTKDTYQDKDGINQGEQNYAFEGLKYKKIRIFSVPQAHALNLGAKGVIDNSERLGGDCDFNFNASKCSIFIRFLLDPSSQDEVNVKEIFDQDPNDLKLLKKCYMMHHTLLNFSLMQAVGGLNDFKGSLCDYDRLDRFVFFLDRYYKTPIEDQRNTPIVIAGEVANRSCLVHYLNQFSKDFNNKEISADKCIYNYCAKIYFLPTEGYPTGMMIKKKADCASENWEHLLKNNKDLIDELIKSGANDFKENTPNYAEYNKKLAIDYMLLAVRFWQAKERYFELMDKIIDSKTAE